MRRWLAIILFLSFQCICLGQLAGYRLGAQLGISANQSQEYQTGVGFGVRTTLEKRIKQFDQIGYLEAGAMLGFTASNVQISIQPDYQLLYKWRNGHLSARFQFVMPIDDRLELYTGVSVGMRYTSFKFVTDEKPPGYIAPKVSPFTPVGALYLGGNFKIANNWLICGELGSDALWLSIGLKYMFL